MRTNIGTRRHREPDLDRAGLAGIQRLARRQDVRPGRAVPSRVGNQRPVRRHEPRRRDPGELRHHIVVHDQVRKGDPTEVLHRQQVRHRVRTITVVDHRRDCLGQPNDARRQAGGAPIGTPTTTAMNTTKLTATVRTRDGVKRCGVRAGTINSRWSDPVCVSTSAFLGTAFTPHPGETAPAVTCTKPVQAGRHATSARETATAFEKVSCQPRHCVIRCCAR
jgi:hypothetical protein